MTLDVLISTLGINGINRVVAMNLPKVEGVNYVVSWQLPNKNEYPATIPAELLRDDIKVYQLNSKGLCRNRNNAINHSTADICHIADDDLKYTAEQLQNVITAFQENPDYDILLFQYNGNGTEYKSYPNYSFDIKNQPKGYFISSFEIAFRLSAVQNAIRFNENFGIGSPKFQCGEEDVFIHDAKIKGLKIKYLPIVIVTHDHPTTGVRDKFQPNFWETKGAVFYYIHRYSWLPRIIINAWRASRQSDKSIFFFTRHAVAGVIYARKNKVF